VYMGSELAGADGPTHRLRDRSTRSIRLRLVSQQAIPDVVSTPEHGLGERLHPHRILIVALVIVVIGARRDPVRLGHQRLVSNTSGTRLPRSRSATCSRGSC